MTSNRDIPISRCIAMGSDRTLRQSQVLSGLKLEILEQALQRSRQENQSATTAWLMEQFRV
ncbi:MAG: hypothetical protein VKJ46_15800 [Leptolyngbyaceae bacterium]|nr:hypothetical protein [Leptolyngbyaceae bacterium]